MPFLDLPLNEYDTHQKVTLVTFLALPMHHGFDLILLIAKDINSLFCPSQGNWNQDTEQVKQAMTENNWFMQCTGVQLPNTKYDTIAIIIYWKVMHIQEKASTNVQRPNYKRLLNITSANRFFKWISSTMHPLLILLLMNFFCSKKLHWVWHV